MKHLFQVFSFDVVSKAMVGVLGILAIRYMSENQYATYVFALALSAVVAQTLSASFNRVYLLAYQSLGLSVNAASFLGLQLIIIVILGIFGFPFFDKLSWVYFLVCTLSVATCLTEYAKTFFQRELRFVRFSLIELLRSATFLIGSLAIIWAVGFGLSAWHLLLMQIASMLLIFWASVGRSVAYKDVIRIRPAITMGERILRGEFSYLFAYFFLLSIFSQIDILILKAFASNIELATYGSAFRYYAVLSLALGSIHAVLLPVIEQADKKQLTDMLAKHRRLTISFALFVMIIAYTASWFMPWIDLGRYPDAVNVFRVLCVSTVISFACSPHVNIILRYGRFRFLLILISIALLLAIVLNMILIPSYGALGVALTTLITSAIVNLPIYMLSLKLNFGMNIGGDR
jgi:O-antigen/teichoic acid export membrane protein